MTLIIQTRMKVTVVNIVQNWMTMIIQNSGLQKIRGQLAYMNIENYKLHCSLFLALKSMDKISVYSVENIVL